VIDWGNNSIRCLQSVKRNAYEAAPKLWRVSTLVGDGQAAVVDGEGVSCLPPLSVLWGGGLRGKKQRQKILGYMCARWPGPASNCNCIYDR